jgi:hypothetical protein
MPEYQVDLRDVRFTLFEHLKIQNLGNRPLFEDQDQELYDSVLVESERLNRTVVSPLNEIGDREGIRFEDGKVYSPEAYHVAYKTLSGSGWVGMAADPKWGGMGFPQVMSAASAEMCMGACVSFMFTPGLAAAAARVIAECGSRELAETYVKRMFLGEWAGTMCLTEPHAGTAVGDTRTSAVRQSDGSYLLSGTKIFISQGDHDLTDNIIHLVLARTPDAPVGTKGLSLFLVPKVLLNEDGTLGDPNDVACVSVEEKMGIHGSSTCTMGFGENGNCKGWIIGEEGAGMKHMFLMMNEARIEVGLQGVGIGNAAYQLALNYAKERVQGTRVEDMRDPNAERVTIIDHPNVRRMLMECKALGEGIRALCYRTALAIDNSRTAEDEKEREREKALVELLTPVVKAYSSEAGFRMTDLAMQILGGAGYIKDYGVEQHMRDVRIAAIYEGTNSIQALDLIGRKLPRAGGRDFMNVVSQFDRTVEDLKNHPILGKAAQSFAETKDKLVACTMALAGYQMQNDMRYPVQICKQYLELFGDMLLAWLLLQQAEIAHDRFHQILEEDPDRTAKDHPELRFYDAKVKTAQFFVSQFLPRARANAARIESGDRSAIEVTF